MTLTDYADFFLSSKLDCDDCSIRPFEIDDPAGTQLITSHLHSLNSVLSKQADAVLDSYVATDLIQHLLSLRSRPLVCIQMKSSDVHIAVSYQKFNKIAEISPITISRVDEVVGVLGGGSVFS